MSKREQTKLDEAVIEVAQSLVGLPPDICQAHARVKELRGRCACEAADLKDLRKMRREAEDYLDELLGDAAGGQGRIFDGDGEPTAQAENGGGGMNDLRLLGVIDEGETGDDESWREAPLETLLGESLPGEQKPHIPPGILEKLGENARPILTLGDLTDWIADKGDFWHKDIPGIGKGAADKIAAATDAFWAARQKAAQAAASAAEMEKLDAEAEEFFDGQETGD